MKKALILSAVIGIIFTMSNCDNSASPMRDDIMVEQACLLVGVWVNVNGITWTFTETTVTQTQGSAEDNNFLTPLIGTYIIYNDHIIITVNREKSLVNFDTMALPFLIYNSNTLFFRGPGSFTRKTM